MYKIKHKKTTLNKLHVADIIHIIVPLQYIATLHKLVHGFYLIYYNSY